jgi:hypothetical protein
MSLKKCSLQKTLIMKASPYIWDVRNHFIYKVYLKIKRKKRKKERREKSITIIPKLYLIHFTGVGAYTKR